MSGCVDITLGCVDMTSGCVDVMFECAGVTSDYFCVTSGWVDVTSGCVFSSPWRTRIPSHWASTTCPSVCHSPSSTKGRSIGHKVITSRVRSPVAN